MFIKTSSGWREFSTFAPNSVAAVRLSEYPHCNAPAPIAKVYEKFVPELKQNPATTIHLVHPSEAEDLKANRLAVAKYLQRSFPITYDDHFQWMKDGKLKVVYMFQNEEETYKEMINSRGDVRYFEVI